MGFYVSGGWSVVERLETAAQLLVRILCERTLSHTEPSLANHSSASTMAEAGPTIEELFKGQGEKPGVSIWDVANFALEPLPDKLRGTFHTGKQSHAYTGCVQTEPDRVRATCIFCLGGKHPRADANEVARGMRGMRGMREGTVRAS